MKIKLLLLSFVFLAACASPAPEIIYVQITTTPGFTPMVITTTPEPTPEVQFASPEFYFNSWEASGVDGMFFPIDDYYLVFAKNEGAALHEVGHLVDAGRDYPSQSVEFGDAVVLYLESCTESPCWRINHLYEKREFDQIFAELYVWDILREVPQEFEEFYAR